MFTQVQQELELGEDVCDLFLKGARKWGCRRDRPSSSPRKKTPPHPFRGEGVGSTRYVRGTVTKKPQVDYFPFSGSSSSSLCSLDLLRSRPFFHGRNYRRPVLKDMFLSSTLLRLISEALVRRRSREGSHYYFRRPYTVTVNRFS